MANSTTPAQARRALAQAIKRDIEELKSMRKRASTFKASREKLQDFEREEEEEEEDDE